MAADTTPPGPTPGPANDTGTDALWLESYRQANAYARDINDDLSRLVTNALLFNGILVAGLAVLFGEQAAGPFVNLIPDLLFAVAVFGTLFNAGAVFSWSDAYRQWEGVHRVLADVETQRRGRVMALQGAVGAASTGLGRVARFSGGFFALFALFWFCLGLWLWYWIRWDIIVFTVFM